MTLKVCLDDPTAVSTMFFHGFAVFCHGTMWEVWLVVDIIMTVNFDPEMGVQLYRYLQFTINHMT